jgi:hypothetical protein
VNKTLSIHESLLQFFNTLKFGLKSEKKCLNEVEFLYNKSNCINVSYELRLEKQLTIFPFKKQVLEQKYITLCEIKGGHISPFKTQAKQIGYINAIQISIQNNGRAGDVGEA